LKDSGRQPFAKSLPGIMGPGSSAGTTERVRSVSIFKQRRGCESAFSRRHSPEFCITITLLKERGRREGRVLAAPMVTALNGLRKCALTDRFSRNTPAFPAQWFTAYIALSPVNQRLPPLPARCVSIAACLAPAWARQDHTTSLVRKSRRSSVGAFTSTATRPAFVTTAIRPSCRGGMNAPYADS